MNRRFRGLLTLPIIVLGTALAQFTGKDPSSQSMIFDRDLIENSEVIAVVKVASAHSYWGRDSLIWTTYNFFTQERLKGSLASSFSMEAKGGEVGEMGMINSNSPRFLQGKGYLLFLKRNESGEQVVVDPRRAVAVDMHGTESRNALQNLRFQISTFGKEKKNVDR